ncbi:hypothetical protein GCM10011591_13800 [Nocardia camponoti]|uniref:Secreted protein n=1 Tax=Nocardia camponoti TaxID=1616106 RepID=A0A917QCI7_9NOCA|nr:hypothetical protein GCM10011591_13800 [Nocardia camponoti]
MQQLVTVLGVLLGATSTFAFAAVSERAKWRRAERSKWDERRLVAYNEFAHALKGYSLVSMRMAATRGYPAAAQPIDLTEGVEMLGQATEAKALKWEALLLLGSPDAVAAGRRWNKAVWDLSHVGNGMETSHADYVERYEECGRLRNEFYERARLDLGIGSGELPVGDQAWLPPGSLSSPATN